MHRPLRAAVLFSGALILGTFVGVLSRATPARADALADIAPPPAVKLGAAVQPPHDPKRKKAGEPCKSNDECQQHHKCAKVGDATQCVAPPPPRLPPGVVT